MLYPVTGKMIEKTNSRYSLVLAVAKRARMLSEGSTPLVNCDSDKPVSIAVQEIMENKIIIIDKYHADGDYSTEEKYKG